MIAVNIREYYFTCHDLLSLYYALLCSSGFSFRLLRPSAVRCLKHCNYQRYTVDCSSYEVQVFENIIKVG
jgi:hypothetical protein